MKDSVSHAKEFVLYPGKKSSNIFNFLKNFPKLVGCYIITESVLDMGKVSLKSV